MFERSLADLIRGLRGLGSPSQQDEAKFIAQAVDEIRQEIKSKDMELKTAAILKLTYLDMLGYDMSWASFHVVEAMSSPKFHLKVVGYLAAVQSFREDTDVLMLTTNTLKKDLSASAPSEVATALNGLSHIVTPDLARDLALDLNAMLNHSRPQIRKRSVLVLYKVFLKYPEALEHSIVRLREKLEDPDPGVISATVNILCELARRNPEQYLNLAPQLFHILTTSSNNWMLIKTVKLFGSLAPLEPRLVKKLQHPITDLISTTPAISLLYECVHTCIVGGMLQGTSGNALAKTCVDKLAAFLTDPDQNLKYIALLALVKIVPSHPHLLADYQSVILSSVDDQDISIRMRALELVSSMVNQYNIQSIVQHLLAHLVAPAAPSSNLPDAAQSLARASASTSLSEAPASPTTSSSAATLSPAYRLEVSRRIISMCSRDMYDNVTDFEWYLSVLFDLAYVANVDIGREIKDQLIDVTVRVTAIRRTAVTLMDRLLADDLFLENSGVNGEGKCGQALWAAAWICGEYSRELPDPQKVITYLLQPRVAALPADIIIVYLQSALKIFGHWAAEIANRWEEDFMTEVKGQVEMIITSLQGYLSNPDVEIQERAADMVQLFTFIRADLSNHAPKPTISPDLTNGFSDPSPSTSLDPTFPKSLYLIRPLSSGYELNPVAPSAQKNVPIPPGLDLDVWIIPPMKGDLSGDEHDGELAPEGKVRKLKGKKKEGESGKKSGRRKKQLDVADGGTLTPEEPLEDPVEKERRRAERLERLRDDPYYLVDNRAATKRPPPRNTHDIDSIPIVRLDDMPAFPNASTPPEAKPTIPVVINKSTEMPQGVTTPVRTPALETSSEKVDDVTTTPYKPFPPYEVDEGVKTPEPIKVKKKKKTGDKAKKQHTEI